MQNTETNGRGYFGLPLFLAGMATGIAVAVLMAPRSGEATRRIIGSKVEEGEDWVKAKAAAAQKYVSTHGAELGEKVKKTAEAIGRG